MHCNWKSRRWCCRFQQTVDKLLSGTDTIYRSSFQCFFDGAGGPASSCSLHLATPQAMLPRVSQQSRRSFVGTACMVWYAIVSRRGVHSQGQCLCMCRLRCRAWRMRRRPCETMWRSWSSPTASPRPCWPPPQPLLTGTAKMPATPRPGSWWISCATKTGQLALICVSVLTLYNVQEILLAERNAVQACERTLVIQPLMLQGFVARYHLTQGLPLERHDMRHLGRPVLLLTRGLDRQFLARITEVPEQLKSGVHKTVQRLLAHSRTKQHALSWALGQSRVTEQLPWYVQGFDHRGERAARVQGAAAPAGHRQ